MGHSQVLGTADAAMLFADPTGPGKEHHGLHPLRSAPPPGLGWRLRRLPARVRVPPWLPQRWRGRLPARPVHGGGRVLPGRGARLWVTAAPAGPTCRTDAAAAPTGQHVESGGPGAALPGTHRQSPGAPVLPDDAVLLRVRRRGTRDARHRFRHPAHRGTAAAVPTRRTHRTRPRAGRVGRTTCRTTLSKPGRSTNPPRWTPTRRTACGPSCWPTPSYGAPTTYPRCSCTSRAT